MGLSFRNDTREGLYLAFLMWDPSCWENDEPFWVQSGEQFCAHGWYRIEPGRTQEVCEGDVGDWHRWWGFHALSDTGRFWAGPYGMTVPWAAFEQCYSVGKAAEMPPGTASQPVVEIGFRGILMDDDYDDYLVTLAY